MVSNINTKFHAAFTEKAHKKQLYTHDIILRIFVKGAERNQDIEAIKRYIRAAFKPIINTNKLANGHYPYHALYLAITYIHYSDLFVLLTDEEKNAIMLYTAAIKGRMYGGVNL